jgi:formamidopyrimidine-DNA glycosylase
VALAEWQGATSEPEQHLQWSQFHANALQDALRKANTRRKEILSAMTQNDWRLAVHRGMQADLWLEDPQPNEQTEHSAMSISELSSSRRNGNGSHPKMGAATSGAV